MKTRQLCLYFTRPQSVRLHFPLIAGWHKRVASYGKFSSSHTCVLFTGIGTLHSASRSEGTRNKTFEKKLRQNNTVPYGKWPQRESQLRFASSLAVGQCQATMARADARNIGITAAGQTRCRNANIWTLLSFPSHQSCHLITLPANVYPPLFYPSALRAGQPPQFKQNTCPTFENNSKFKKKRKKKS